MPSRSSCSLALCHGEAPTHLLHLTAFPPRSVHPPERMRGLLTCTVPSRIRRCAQSPLIPRGQVCCPRGLSGQVKGRRGAGVTNEHRAVASAFFHIFRSFYILSMVRVVISCSCILNFPPAIFHSRITSWKQEAGDESAINGY